MNISRKLFLNTAAVVAFVFIAVFSSIFSIQKMRQDVEQLAVIEEPLERAILELEINANETALAVFDYILTPSPHDLERITDSEADFGHFLKIYESIAQTEDEKVQAQIAGEVYRVFKELGTEITLISKRRFDDLQSFRQNRFAIDQLIKNKIQVSIDRGQADAFVKLEAALEMEHQIDSAFAAIEGYMVQPDDNLKQKSAAAQETFRSYELQYRETGLSQEEEVSLAAISQAFAAAMELGAHIISRSDRLHKRLREFHAALEQFDQLLDEEMQAPISKRAQRAAEDALASGATAILITITVGFVALGITVAVSWITSTRIVRSIAGLSEGVSEFGRGNFQHRIAVESKDELGRLAVAFNEMADHRERDEALLKESELWLRSAFEVVTVGLIVIDENGLIESFNESAQEIFGYETDEVIGKNVKMLMPEPYVSEHDTYLQNYKKTADPQIIGSGREVMGLRKNGETFPMHLGVGEMKVGARRSFVGSTIDLTERRNLERMKSEFVSTVSHELRTPLTSIKGSLGLIGAGALGELPAKADDLLDVALRNTERLVNLVNDILMIESLESGKIKFDFQSVDLSGLAREAVELNAGFATECGVTFRLSELAPEAIVRGDGDRLIQVLANLLSNAAKYSPEGGVVEISVVNDDGVVKASVSDKGAGIANEFRDRIFGKFAQEDSSDSRAKGGTGLGLNITKTIVEEHGGIIDFDSEVGVGSTFYFTLPSIENHRIRPEAHNGNGLRQAS